MVVVTGRKANPVAWAAISSYTGATNHGLMMESLLRSRAGVETHTQVTQEISPENSNLYSSIIIILIRAVRIRKRHDYIEDAHVMPAS
jgi:hypothetical protein